MNTRNCFGIPAALLLASVMCGALARAEQIAIDTTKSVMTVRVYKAGVFSAFAHDHEITAPIAGGAADTTAHRVELRVNAATLRVTDPGASEKDRSETQKNMLGPQVLDVERHPEIVFKSTGVEAAGPDAWTVHGDLTLHGESKPVTVEVHEKSGHYVGTSRLKQTEFGMKPIKVAGGTVRVKDEVRIEFDIQLAR